MPGRFFLSTPLADVAATLGGAATRNDPPRYNVAPGQEIAVWNGALTHMRWGIVPVGRVNARGRPVMEQIINARSETVFDKSAFEGVGRAVVPADGWYEWTGETRKKQAWRITRKDQQLLWFAAITDLWTAPGGLEVPQVATVTCPPSADVRDIHHRMGVILQAKDIDAWLHGDEGTAKALMQPWPDGTLKVTKADDVDWDGA